MSKAKARKCVQCGGPIRKPKKLQVRKEHYESDPFCSRACCETAHGVVQPGNLLKYRDFDEGFAEEQVA